MNDKPLATGTSGVGEADIPPEVTDPPNEAPMIEREEIIRTVMEATLYAGPIPPPHMLKDYEQVCPGFANRTLTMSEDQARHRREIEMLNAKANISSERRSQWMAFGLAAMVFAIGGGAIFEHQTTIGGAVMGVDAAAIIGLFFAELARNRKAKSRLPNPLDILQALRNRSNRSDGTDMADTSDGAKD